MLKQLLKFKNIAFLICVFVSQIAWGQMNFYNGNGITVMGDPTTSVNGFGSNTNQFEVRSCFYNVNFDVSITINGTYNVVNTSNPGTIISTINSGMQTRLNNIQLGSYEIINSNTQAVFATFNVMPKYNVEIKSISLSGYKIVKDTLFICAKEETMDVYMNMYQFSVDNSPICKKSISNFGGGMLGEKTYINKKEASFSNAVLKNGDKLEVRLGRIYGRDPSFGNNIDPQCTMFCFNQNSDSLVSQEVTVKLVQNEILPKPILKNNIKSICAGDTATLIRNNTLNQVYTISNNSYNYSDTVSTKKITSAPTTVYLRSINTKANGCYAVSDTVHILRKNCGFTKIRGIVYQEIGYMYGPYDKGIDPVFDNVKVSLKIGNNTQLAYAYTNQNGVYEFTIDSTLTKYQNVYVSIADANYYQVNNYASFSGSNQYYELNLKTYLLASNDLSTTLTSGRNRPGFTIPLFLNVENRGKATNKGNLTLQLDANYTLVDATPVPTTIVGNTLTWDLDSIKSSNTSYLRVNAKLSPSIALGTNLKSTLTLTPAIPDLNASNNLTVLDAIVTGSFDPNDITVTPKGFGEEGFIKATDSLDYVIRCQNMGTDTAFTIVVKSPISPYWDLSTFKMIDASHSYQLNINKDTLVWTFANILMPDNKVDEPNSHAQLHFKVKQKAGNAPLTQIKASAGIYFDYNAPVMTNVALNTIEQPTGIENNETKGLLKLYPNPTSGEFVIQEIGLLNIYNQLGEKVYSTNNQSNTSINVSNLPIGIYYVELINEKANLRTKLILK